MKFIFLTAPFYGHINPMLGVAKELVEDKHRVIFYNTREFSSKVKNIGAGFYPPPFAVKEIKGKTLTNVLNIAELSISNSKKLIGYLEKIVKKEKPDCIVHDSFALWGKIVASKTKTPAVALIPSMAINTAVIAFFSRYVLDDYAKIFSEPMRVYKIITKFNSLYEKNGLGEAPFFLDMFSNSEKLNVVFTSSYLQPARRTLDKSYKFVGPIIYDRKEGEAPQSTSKDPLIYISFGTLFNYNFYLYKQLIECFSGTRYQVLMSVGKNVDISSFGKLPKNIIVKDYLPQIEILKKATLFISHGGMNSVNESMYFGVPMIFFPQIQEQRINSKRVEDLKAGIYYKEKQIDKKELLSYVNKIIKDKTYKNEAEKIGATLRSAGGAKKAKQFIYNYLSEK